MKKIECDELYLQEGYPDLLKGNADPKLTRLVRELDTAYEPVEPPAHLSTAIRQALDAERAGTSLALTASTTPGGRVSSPDGRMPGLSSWLSDRLARFSSRQVPQYAAGTSDRAITAVSATTQSADARVRRPMMAFALVAAVLCLMGAGYVAMPALEHLFEVHTGTRAIIYNNLGREVNITQTVDGFTVAVRRVYADPNHVVIGLTVSGPQGRTFNHIMPWGEWYGYDPQRGLGTSPVLTDDQSRGFSGGMGGEQGALQEGSTPYLLDYDGVGIGASGVDLPKEIHVHLKIGMLSAYEQLPGDKYQEIFVQGPFGFNLTIPVESGRVADLHQTVEAGGHKVTLERVVTAPTGTRVSLRGAGPNAEVRLTVGGQTYDLGPPDGQAIPFQWSADSVWEYLSGTLLGDKADGGAEWELTVRPTPPLPPDVGQGATKLEGGPWTFRFTMR
jgi:Domain of unknown function (DUF4179)